MTEKEKMLSGMQYNPMDGELYSALTSAKNLCHAFNSLLPSKKDEGKEILKRLIGKINGSFTITPYFWCDYGSNIELGDHFYSNHNLVILDCAKVVFGKNVLIGPNCGFYTACHPTDPTLRKQGIEFAKPITVGDNVWFGGGVNVMPGVSIGSNTVIGGGSVVTHSIPSGVIAAGNPCKIIKNI